VTRRIPKGRTDARYRKAVISDKRIDSLDILRGLALCGWR
jgi:uncharacterized membrane protein YeiB